MRLGRALLVTVLAAAATLACENNMLIGKLTPVPPVHRVPVDTEGAVVLLDQDAAIESTDPVHHVRAKEKRVPQDLRAAMVDALLLAGYKVVQKADEPHDLVAHVAINVSEPKGKVKQTYRCGLKGLDGTEVIQVDWTWPDGTYVDIAEVYAFATHHVANEISMSPRVADYVRAHRRKAASASGGTDAGPAAAPAQDARDAGGAEAGGGGAGAGGAGAGGAGAGGGGAGGAAVGSGAAANPSAGDAGAGATTPAR
ncbi:MAG: hypothetical protein JST00_03610 [Deltaproteobacteria bacterium]|nr:hypothetical protein [Deltaproteobacteria bacterium]